MSARDISIGQPRLLGISGSLRRGSHCTAVLHALAPLVEGRAQVEVTTLHEVPLYNADLGAAAPVERDGAGQTLQELRLPGPCALNAAPDSRTRGGPP